MFQAAQDCLVDWRSRFARDFCFSNRRLVRSFGAFPRDSAAVAAVEFAFIAPILLLMGLGFLVFGIAMNEKVIVSHAAAAGIQQFSLSRGASTPYTSTVAAIKSAATGLTAANLTITLSVNGTACANDSACSTALSAAASQPANVKVAYPCTLKVMGLVYGSSVCQVSSSVTGMVQ